MKKSLKIFIYIFALALISLAIFIGLIAKNRYYDKPEPEKNPTEKILFQGEKTENKDTNPNDTPGEFLDPEDKEEDLEEEMQLEKDFAENNTVEKESYLEIKKDDCKNKCADFKDEKADFRYCQEVCGLVEPKKESSSEECEDLEDLEMDYCLRDFAISKKDYELCEKIEDKNISLNCQNRITEEILEEQKKL
ncbi:MAG: hypothetical protein WAV31_01515 [Candidatus Moraniibacteriota bacterium]